MEVIERMRIKSYYWTIFRSSTVLYRYVRVRAIYATYRAIWTVKLDLEAKNKRIEAAIVGLAVGMVVLP